MSATDADLTLRYLQLHPQLPAPSGTCTLRYLHFTLHPASPHQLISYPRPMNLLIDLVHNPDSGMASLSLVFCDDCHIRCHLLFALCYLPPATWPQLPVLSYLHLTLHPCDPGLGTCRGLR